MSLVLLGLAGAAQGQGEAPEYRFENGHSTSDIPIRLASGKVHVQVGIGEASPEWFLLDSGANMTIFNLELAERLGLEL